MKQKIPPSDECQAAFAWRLSRRIGLATCHMPCERSSGLRKPLGRQAQKAWIFMKRRFALAKHLPGRPLQPCSPH